MTIERLALIPLAIGHVALFVYVVNVSHGLGYCERTMSRAKALLLAAFGLGGVLLGVQLLRTPLAAWPWPLSAYAALCVLTAVVFLPLGTLAIHLRPTPEAVDALRDEVDLTEGRGRDPLIGDGRYAWMLRISRNEAFRLQLREWEVAVPRLPTALDGLSVLHFSDLHLAPCFRLDYFERVFDQLARLESDLALFTGDLVEHEAALGWIVPLFGRVRGRVGSHAILGNHDAKHDREAIMRQLAQAGYTPLDGGWDAIETPAGRIALAGTAHPWGEKPPAEARPVADLHILLSHAPDLFPWAARAGFDLMLSGHNHGGQVRLPLLGPVFMPSLYSRRYDRGFFRRGDLLLHVSQGVAGQHPIRFGCPPEVGRLILRTPLSRRPLRHFARQGHDAREEVAS